MLQPIRAERFITLGLMTFGLVVSSVLVHFSRIAMADETNPIGIVSVPAKSGPCIPIDEGKGGYMVPYLQVLGETGISFEMIPVPGGKVVVGSLEGEPGHREDEGPRYQVELAPYWIGKTEVTWGEFSGFMRSYGIFKKQLRRGILKIESAMHVDAVTVPTPLYAEMHHREFGNDPKHPAVTMTQYSAKQYTKWLSGLTGVQYRLPTNAEWEHAARAGSTEAYCFGNDVRQLDRFAVHSQTSGSSIVGSKEPNAFGIHDMHGNVWEWTVEQYSAKGYRRQDGKTYQGHDGTDWATMVNSQSVRGGSWIDPPDRVRSASRLGSDRNEWAAEDPDVPTSPWWYTSDPSRMVGMRLVRSSKPLGSASIRKFWENEIQDLQDDINTCLQEGRGGQGLPVPELLKELKP